MNKQKKFVFMVRDIFYVSLRIGLLKLRGFVSIIRIYQNWPIVTLDHLHLLKNKDTLVYKIRNGLKIITRTDDYDRHVIDNIFSGEYEVSGFTVNKTDTVVVIGAHIGAFTLYAAQKATNGKVIAYEPSTDNFRQLVKNIGLNGYKNITVHNLAVSDRCRKVRLYLPSSSFLNNNLFRKNDNFELVKSVTLKDIFSHHKIDKCHFLKLDCEGAEYDILISAPGDILNMINRIVFEYHPKINPKYRFCRLIEYLKKNKFKIIADKKSPEWSTGLIFAQKSS